MTAPFALWTYLAATPLLWLTVTVLAWIAADAARRGAAGDAAGPGC